MALTELKYIKDTHPKPLTATYLCRLLTPDRLGGIFIVGCVRSSNQNFLMRPKYLDTIIYSLCISPWQKASSMTFTPVLYGVSLFTNIQ
jgi:hypothetical protein